MCELRFAHSCSAVWAQGARTQQCLDIVCLMVVAVVGIAVAVAVCVCAFSKGVLDILEWMAVDLF